jgi:PAS domain S-box-containing protein
MDQLARIRELEAELAHLRRSIPPTTIVANPPVTDPALFMQLPIPLTIYTLTGEASAVNQAFCARFNLTADQIVGRYNLFADPEAHTSGEVAHFTQARQGSVAESIPTPYIPASTSTADSFEDLVCWARTTYFPICDAHGTITHVGELTFDVTEQVRSKHAERSLYEALAERDRRFRALFDNNGMGIVLVDAAGRLIEANAAICRMLGLNVAQLRGNRMGTYTHPDDVAEDHRLFAELVAGTRSFYQLEKRYIRNDGTIMYGRLTNSTIRDEHGQVQFVMRLIEDVTAQRKAEAALRTNQNLLNSLIEALPVYIYAKDLHGRYLLINRRVAEAMGRKIDDVLQRTNRELLASDVAALLDAHDAEVLRTGQTIHFSEQYGEGADTRYFDSVKFVLRDEQGQPYATCGVSSDVTAVKHAEAERLAFERQLLETQKLESLGLMAGSIAHDFNNLLVAMLGNASLALEDLPTESPAHASIAQIELAARRAADLTRQMLAYAGKNPPIFQPVDLNQLIRETARLLHSSIPRQVSIQLDLDPHLLAINGDPTQLRQVVMNLVINGAEAIGNQIGYVQIRTRCEPPAPFSASVGESNALLEVSDNGSGMDSSTQARIFEPFFTTKFTGRGLGLAAVQGIVRSHNGSINVTSMLGTGTTFQVALPMLPTPPAADPTTTTHSARTNPPTTVLVIDDEAEVRSVAQLMLERMGVPVLVAATATEAQHLMQVHAGKIQLVLIDVTMPDMHGGDLAHILYTLQPNVRIIVMSGHSANESLQGFQGLPVQSFLPKPFTFNELAATLHS